ncbi:hypothetical protein ACLKA6_019403 [Drosophila palustris]
MSSLRLEQERQGKLLDEILSKLDRFNTASNRRNCAEAGATDGNSGVYEIRIPRYSMKPFRVACEGLLQGGGWTIILRRLDGSENFYRNWSDYRLGFGNLSGEFFMGLDKIHAMTADQSQELLVVLEDFEGQKKYENYDKFAIGDELESYALHTLGKASGTAGDSLSLHYGLKFSTFDRDNDPDVDRNCAVLYTGAWWYKNCHSSHLTGKYNDNISGKGINWLAFRGHEYSLKRAVMMIRPRK